MSEPFGTIVGGTLGDEHQFASHPFDRETGMVNARGRIYDPATAAFLTADPVRVATAPMMNLYSYVVNDPVNLWDPTGFQPDLPVGPPGDHGTLGGGSGPPHEAGSGQAGGPSQGYARRRAFERRRARRIRERRQRAQGSVPGREPWQNGPSTGDPSRVEGGRGREPGGFLAGSPEGRASYWSDVATEAGRSRATTNEVLDSLGARIGVSLGLSGLSGAYVAGRGMQTPLGIVLDVARSRGVTFSSRGIAIRRVLGNVPGGNFAGGRWGLGSAVVGRLLVGYGVAEFTWAHALEAGSYPSAMMTITNTDPPGWLTATRAVSRKSEILQGASDAIRSVLDWVFDLD